MSDCICRIEKAANGYEVELYDPAIAKANAKKGKWRDPMVCHVFTDLKTMMKFLTENLPNAGPEDEYSSTFDMLSEEDDDE